MEEKIEKIIALCNEILLAEESGLDEVTINGNGVNTAEASVVANKILSILEA